MASSDGRSAQEPGQPEHLGRGPSETGEHPLHDLVQRNEQWTSPPYRLDSLTRWTRDTTVFLLAIVLLVIVIVVIVKWM